jgi:hypothetical protein
MWTIHHKVTILVDKVANELSTEWNHISMKCFLQKERVHTHLCELI